MRKDQGIWNSFTTVPNLTDLILTADRLPMAVVVECRNLWIQWCLFFNLSASRYIHGDVVSRGRTVD